jgi:Zn-dependent oligopeptidase
MKATLEKLSEKLNGKYWGKGGLKRVYLTRGHNTKKMSTKVYIEQINLEYVVKCFVECPSQDMNWCKSQADIVIKSVQKEIKEALATEYFYVLNAASEVVNDCLQVEVLQDLYVGAGLYLSKEDAQEFIELEDIEATILSISRDNFESLEILK